MRVRGASRLQQHESGAIVHYHNIMLCQRQVRGGGAGQVRMMREGLLNGLCGDIALGGSFDLWMDERGVLTHFVLFTSIVGNGAHHMRIFPNLPGTGGIPFRCGFLWMEA